MENENKTTKNQSRPAGAAGKRPTGTNQQKGSASAKKTTGSQHKTAGTTGSQHRAAGHSSGNQGGKKKLTLWQKFQRLNTGRKALIITLIVLLVLILTVVVGGYLVINGYINKTNYISDHEVTQVATLPAGAEEMDGEGEEMNQEALESLQDQMNQIGNQEAIGQDYVYNILLIGVDRRDTSWAGNSDAMMLMSINSKSKKIYITSLMRDTYVSIPGIGNKKLNAAHAHGAGPLLVQTVTENFKVQVDRYARVDFSSLTTIIDQLGGIPMTLSDAEVKVANNYIHEMNTLQGRPYDESILSGGGDLHLNGIQATAYARIRYVGNADWGRTERQRKVLQAMINQIKSAGIGALPGLANAFLPLITHNVPDSEIWAKIAEAPEILGYEIVMDRIPYDGMYTMQNIGGQGMLVPDWPATIAKLQSTIYATE